jgi:DUF971 family protein
MAALPKEVQVLGDELAIVWADGAETYLKLQDLRRLCPCASCAGEGDLLGRVYKPPEKPLTKESYVARGTSPVGGYALQIFWGDGHADGLYTYARLRAWGENPPQLPPVTAFPLLPTV